MLLSAFYVLFCCIYAHPCAGQASAIPSAQPSSNRDDPQAGRKLLDQMIAALGGPAWLKRTQYSAVGRSASFYKGQANPYVSEFEQYVRLQPFGERVVLVSKQGVFIPTAKRDVAVIWTGDNGYEVTYKGKKELPKKEVDDFVRRRKHSLEVVIGEWLKQPGTLVTYEGTDVVDRKLADKVSILTAGNDGVVLELEESTHLPLSRTFRFRNETYKDFDTDVEQYDDYHPIEGVMTPLTLTRLHNGDMSSQIFLREVKYNVNMPADLFDPDRPLMKSAKK